MIHRLVGGAHTVQSQWLKFDGVFLEDATFPKQFQNIKAMKSRLLYTEVSFKHANGAVLEMLKVTDTRHTDTQLTTVTLTRMRAEG